MRTSGAFCGSHRRRSCYVLQPPLAFNPHPKRENSFSIVFALEEVERMGEESESESNIDVLEHMDWLPLLVP